MTAILAGGPVLEGGFGAIGVYFFGQIATFFMDTIEAPLNGLRNVKPGDEDQASREAFKAAFISGQLAHALGAMGEILHPIKNLGLDKLAAAMADLASFSDVSKARLGPLLDTHIGIPARYAAMAKARPTIPDQARLNEMFARRIIEEPQWRTAIPYSGIATEWEQPLLDVAYRPPQPFQLLRGLGLLVIDKTPTLDAMRYAGFREQDITALIASAERQGLQPLVQQIIAQAITTAAEGLLSDADLSGILSAIG